MLSSSRHISIDELITQLRSSALAAVNPASAIDRYVQRDGDRLIVADQVYPLQEIDLRCVALGKAAVPMAQSIADIIGEDCQQGLVVTKYGHLGAVTFPGGWSAIEAAHPTPDEQSLAAGNRLWELLADCTDQTVIITCISGGASALVVAPQSWQSLQQLLSDRSPAAIAPPIQQLINSVLAMQGIEIATVDPALEIPLTTLQGINHALLGSGLDIAQINAVRARLDRLKDGGLVRRAQPGKVVGLILSDVIGDSIATIASGLTNHPAATNTLIGSNLQACRAVAQTARQLGYHPQIVTTTLAGAAHIRGQEIAREIVTKPPKTVLIYGGETTVILSPDCQGQGGRNQELALAAAIELSTQATPAWVVTLATDGTDGPTDAAGASVNELTIDRAIELGLDARTALDRHDSYPFLMQLGDLHQIGPTGTNVADLTIAIRP